MSTTLLRTLHEAAGARLAALPEAPGSTAPLTYGDVPGEYRAGVEGALLLDATTRGSVAVTGGDAADFLHRITANDVRGLAPGTSNLGLLLTPKGKVQQAFEVVRTDAGLELVTAPDAAAEVLAALDSFLFTEDAVLEDRSSTRAPIELVGPEAAAVVRVVLGEALPDVPHTFRDVAFGGAPCRVLSTPVAGSLGLRLDPGPERVADLWRVLADAGATPGGFFARDSLRIEAGAALFGLDVDANVFPQEARLEAAFSLTKGCYTGQEVVAKIDTYGGVNKRLIVLAIEGDDPVARGTRLMREQGGEGGEARDVGLVTSWSYSFALDRGIALGYAKRKHQAVGTTYRLGADGPTATSIAFPVREHALAPTGDFEPT
ncbi:MAG: glycine cleavage T C-terminal barrel domain-containing protein [Planctomycetota bacterium]